MDVVLLHGLAGTQFTMWKIARELRRSGFSPLNIYYPSTRQPLEKLAVFVLEKIRRKLPGFRAGIDFISYSMGGILVRLIARECPGSVRRAVMIAPPNQGSFWAARCGEIPLLGTWMGPAGRQLGAVPGALPNRLGPVNFPLGVIAGTRADNPLALWLSSEPGDGRVSVAQTYVEGMKAHCNFHYGHLELPFRKPVIQSAIHFLSYEEFPN